MKQGKMGVMRRKAYQIGVWIGAVVLSIGLSSLIYAVNLTEGIKEIETEMKNLTVPNTVQVVGIGEASHGVKEYQEMKAEVFKALVANNGCQTFVIEGDFGGALSVEDYIHGGNQGATEAIKNIGFRIYETQEMVDLIKWMRTYNESAPEGKDLHFYGMDMQRFDQGKAYLFSVLDRALPEISETYKNSLKNLTDAKRLELSKEEANKAGKEVETLLKEMESRKKTIIEKNDAHSFDLALACANAMYEYCKILSSPDALYSSLRDQFMAKKVKWLLERDPGKVLLINGHNGHISKISTSLYTSLGEHLQKEMGQAYFAIGTDAKLTTFNSQDNNGEFSVRKVENTNAVIDALGQMDNKGYYMDLAELAKDPKWDQLVSEKVRVTSINVGLSDWQTRMKSAYSIQIVLPRAYDGWIVFNQVHPTTWMEKVTN